MNRIRVGTVDGIDKTYVELKAKKFRFRCDPNSVCTFEIQGVTL